jgi:hypothetical protein
VICEAARKALDEHVVEQGVEDLRLKITGAFFEDHPPSSAFARFVGSSKGAEPVSRSAVPTRSEVPNADKTSGQAQC